MEHDAYVPHGGGGGRGGRGRRGGGGFGRGVSSNPCREYARGQCSYGNQCKFSHDIGGGGGHGQQGGFGSRGGGGGGVFGRIQNDMERNSNGGFGGGSNQRGGGGGRWGSRGGRGRGRGGRGRGEQSNGPCQRFLRGTCTYGDNCRNAHTYASANDVDLVMELVGHEGNVTSIALVGDQLYSASNDGTIRVWDSDGTCTNSVAVGGPVDSMLVESGFLFAGVLVKPGDQGLIKAWDMSGGAQFDMPGHQGEIYSMVAANNMLFSGGRDNTIRVWSYDVNTKQFAHGATLQAHTKAVLVLEVADGLLISGGADGHIMLWDLTAGTCVQDIEAHSNMVMSMVYWQHHLLSCGMDGMIKVWGYAPGTPPGQPPMGLLQQHPAEEPGGGSPFGGGGGRGGGPKKLNPLVAICGTTDLQQAPILLASYTESRVTLLELPTFKERGKAFFPSPEVEYVRALANGPGGMFFTGDSSGVVKVWKWV